jgi:hypothetical protein
MKKIKLILTLAIFSTVLNVNAQTIEGYSFEKYDAEGHHITNKATINYQSNPKAKLFRTRITEGYNLEKTDFAGSYITIIWGCGTGCIDGVMVDIRDGKVYDLPLGEERAYMGCYSNYETDEDKRVNYNLYSRLFITVACSETDITNTNNFKQEKTFFINVWNEQERKFELINKFNRIYSTEVKKVTLIKSSKFGTTAYRHSAKGCLKFSSDGAIEVAPPMLKFIQSTIILMSGDKEMLKIEGKGDKKETSKMTENGMLYSTSYTGRMYDGESYDNITYALIKVVGDKETNSYLYVYYKDGDSIMMNYEN